MYEEQNKRDDSLIEVLRDLADFDLFWKLYCNPSREKRCPKWVKVAAYEEYLQNKSNLEKGYNIYKG